MTIKKLPTEVESAARALVEAILADPQAQAYQRAIAALENDPEAAALEKRFMDFYTQLITRQQTGQQLPQDEIQHFYAMRAEYNENPLVSARTDALGLFKPLLAEAGENISAQIGLDFTELARAA